MSALGETDMVTFTNKKQERTQEVKARDRLAKATVAELGC